MSLPPELAAGVIHDIGYRHYEGTRQDRWQAVLAIFTHSLRGMYGLGRPARARVVPFLLFAVMCLPAAVSGALSAVVPVIPPIPYAHYTYYLQVAVVVFLAAQAPQVVSGDLRFRVLSLYFSRPPARADYAAAKLGAVAAALLLLMAAPLVIIYLAVLLTHTHSVGDAAQETGRLLVGLTGAAIQAVALAALGMAISAFTRVRALAVVGIVAAYLVSSSVAAVTGVVAQGSVAGAAFGLLSPFSLLDGFQSWALRVPPASPLEPGPLGPAYALVLAGTLLAALAALRWRYRRIEP